MLPTSTCLLHIPTHLAHTLRRARSQAEVQPNFRLPLALPLNPSSSLSGLDPDRDRLALTLVVFFVLSLQATRRDVANAGAHGADPLPWLQSSASQPSQLSLARAGRTLLGARFNFPL
ncbi:hypothetical protein MSAN_00847100 [Mycena sanguinolenta]|uniref:Uncharacterized protein n=1 Tax=Mycena sanguinolenta TaxID=230812 RepID=A0A8H7DCH4_9AGAR|nr:hypothetical protein MSAN_00847100 [Mycena sanguinolenta]